MKIEIELKKPNFKKIYAELKMHVTGKFPRQVASRVNGELNAQTCEQLWDHIYEQVWYQVDGVTDQVIGQVNNEVWIPLKRGLHE